MIAQESPFPRRKPSGAISQKERESYVHLFLDGFTPREIAAGFDRRISQVEQAIADAGYKPDRFSVTDEEIDGFVKYHSAPHHWPVSWIAEKFDRSPGTVTNHLLRRGYRPRHPAAKKLYKPRKPRSH